MFQCRPRECRFWRASGDSERRGVKAVQIFGRVSRILGARALNHEHDEASTRRRPRSWPREAAPAVAARTTSRRNRRIRACRPPASPPPSPARHVQQLRPRGRERIATTAKRPPLSLTTHGPFPASRSSSLYKCISTSAWQSYRHISLRFGDELLL